MSDQYDFSVTTKQAQKFQDLVKSVFTTEQGQVLLKYMEGIYQARPASDPYMTYFNLGTDSVVKDIQHALKR